MSRVVCGALIVVAACGDPLPSNEDGRPGPRADAGERLDAPWAPDGAADAAYGADAPYSADGPISFDASVDAATVIDAFTGDAYIPTEARSLGLNDISMLLLLPESTNGTVIARMTGVPGYGVDLVPRDLFATLVTDPGDVGFAYETFHLVAIRIDLCDRLASGPCPAGQDGRLRLVFQPIVSGPLQGMTVAADAGLHAFYPIPAAELPPLVNELRAIARLRDFQTASPLAIMQEIASTSPPSELRTRLRALVARYAAADRLARLTMFAQNANQPPWNWKFRGYERVGDTFRPIFIATIGTRVQRLALEWPAFVATPVADLPVGIELALDRDVFSAATSTQQRGALEALAQAQNPTIYGFGTEQCINCHVSTVLVADRAAIANVDPQTIAGVFTSPRNLSIDFGISATELTSMRAFGWWNQYPAISQRVANETAMVLDEIEQRFPPAAETVLPDAAPLDAPPTVKRVFVASRQLDGDLKTAGGGSDGLDGADRICAAAATSGGLGGTWVAWLSTSTVNAIDRVSGNGPWYLVDATTLAFPSKAAILAGPLVPIDLDEHVAQPPGGETVWTGTDADGTVSDDHTCGDWTTNTMNPLVAVGMNGLRSATNAGWTAYADTLCSTQLARLYCFEQ